MNNSTNPNTPDNPADVPARTYGLPITTPLETEPDAGRVEAAAMLSAATIVLTLGAWDRTMVAWLLGKDGGIIATVASWLRRSYRAGVAAGRREVLDETGARSLAGLADDIRGLADHADQVLTEGLSGAQEVLEALLGGLRRTVDVHTTDPGHLAEVAARARRRYFSVVAGDLSSAQRQLALCLAVETARSDLLGDSELAAAVRAVVDADRELDDAVAEVTDPPACGGCETPNCPTRAGELCPRSAVDMALVDQVRGYGAEDQDVDTAEHDAVLQPVLQPGTEIPGIPGFVVGVCGHRIAGSEWRAGFRTCERCPADEGHSTPLAAAGLASGVLGVTGLVATHSGSPGAGLVLAAVGGVIGVVVLVLGRRGRDGGAS